MIKPVITPPMLEATKWRMDGQFWIQYNCERCGDPFYEYASENLGMNAIPRRCGVCRGQRTAAEEAHRNVRIEANSG